MNILTPDLITAVGGLAATLLFIWYSLRMTRMQADDADKVAERQAESQKHFTTFVERTMDTMAEMNKQMASVTLQVTTVVLQVTTASQEQSKTNQEMSRDFTKALNKNNELLTALLSETRMVAVGMRSNNET